MHPTGKKIYCDEDVLGGASSAMIYLLLAILFGTLIGHVFKLRDRLGTSTFPILLVNYVAALLISAVQVDNFDFGTRPAGAAGLAVSLGLLFVLCYVLMNHTIGKLGVSISVSLTRLSAVLPTVGSMLLFGEEVRMLQIPGLLLAFLSLPLSAQELPNRGNIRRLLHGGLGWGLLLFLAMGINDFIFKLKGEFFLSVDHSTFLLLVYAVALALCSLVVYRRKLMITRTAVWLGIVLGGVNYATATSIMAAMEVLPGMLAYPINGIGVILLTSVSSVILWREKLQRHNYIFVAAAVVAIWLINIRGV